MKSATVTRSTIPIVNQTLRAEVAARGIKHRWLASVLGVSGTHLARILDGERAPTDAQAEAIAKALHMDVSAVQEAARNSALVRLSAQAYQLGAVVEAAS